MSRSNPFDPWAPLPRFKRFATKEEQAMKDDPAKPTYRVEAVLEVEATDALDAVNVLALGTEPYNGKVIRVEAHR